MKLFKLLGSDGKEYLLETPGTLGGNTERKVYGRLDCPTSLSSVKRFPGSYEKSRIFADEKQPLPQDTVRAVIVCVSNIENIKRTLKSIVRNLVYNILKEHLGLLLFSYILRAESRLQIE